MEAIIFIGIQATGKSTFFQQRFFATHVRINLDMLKRLYWEVYEKPSVNPLTGEQVLARRRRVKVDYELPMKDQYGEFILLLIEESLESE